MKRCFFTLFLLATMVFSSLGLASCSLPFIGSSNTSSAAAFQFIDLVLNHADDVFTIASDSVLDGS